MYKTCQNGEMKNGNSKNGTNGIRHIEVSHGSFKSKESFEKAPFITEILTYLGFYILLFLGTISQLLFPPNVATEKNRNGYVKLYNPFESFYSNYVYRRIKECFNRPITSVPGDTVVIKDRATKNFGWTFEFTGTETKYLNMGSYNYLGFAQNEGPCAEDSIKTLEHYGVSFGSPRRELGNHPLHTELEALTAQFVGAEDAIVFGMGFATNSLNLPALLSPGCLVVSDEKNHASIILGLRLSGATVRVYRHNDAKSLDKTIEKAIIEGQPKSGEPWKKIVIVMEGVFSMEGSIVHLPEIIEVKKKYNAYIYLDEAHSIGATGPHGRGIVDYFGVDPKDIDILMGTFTKSFGSAGGYIAGSKKLINFLRVHSHAHCYANSMAPPVIQQILTSMKIIMGLDGTGEGRRRIAQLAHNTHYFRKRLAQMGVIVYGHEDSPVVPMMLYTFSNLLSVCRKFTENFIAAVVVGYPATPMGEARIRFCLSAAHTKEQLDYVLSVVEKICISHGLRYSRKPIDSKTIVY